MIFRIYKDCVVWTSGHTCFAADAYRFVEIDNAIRPFEHSCCRASRGAWCMHTLVTASHLVSASSVRKHSDFYMLYVGSSNGKRNYVFRLACGGTRMTTDTTCMVNYLSPLCHWLGNNITPSLRKTLICHWSFDISFSIFQTFRASSVSDMLQLVGMFVTESWEKLEQIYCFRFRGFFSQHRQAKAYRTHLKLGRSEK